MEGSLSFEGIPMGGREETGEKKYGEGMLLRIFAREGKKDSL